MGSDSTGEARELVRAAQRVVAFTGAGASTASGVPDFRSEGGLWDRFDPAEFRYERFLRDPEGFWELRAEMTRALELDAAEPNACHDALASAYRDGSLVAVVTQNIDGLHQQAGVLEEDVVEVHGSTRRARCVDCGDGSPIGEALESVEGGDLPPSCSACGGVLKPDVVLFGEPLPQQAFRRAQRLCSGADVTVVAGSSLTVWPAAGLPELTIEEGGEVVVVNGAETSLDDRASSVLRGRVEEIVPALLEESRGG